MKVLIVTETLNEGGAELFVLRLSRKLKSMGIHADVLSLNKAHENQQMTSHYSDVPIIRLSLPFLSLIERIDHLLFKLRIDFSVKYFFQSHKIRVLLKQKYGIIHTNYIRIDYLFSRLNRKKLFKHLVTVHGDYSDHYYKSNNNEHVGWLNVNSKLAYLTANVDHWAVISDEQRSFFIEKMQLTADRIAKIYNGFEPHDDEAVHLPFYDDPNKNFTIGMVARGVEGKGWQILIDSFIKLAAKDARLILTGAGTYIEQLKKKYSDQPDIIFTGFHSNPVQLIRHFDVFVLPTLYPYESLPNVITEAMFCGIPVIATHVGEIEQMITDPLSKERAGVLLDFDGNTIQKDLLFNALNYYYNNPDQLKRLQAIALSAFTKFDMNKCASSYLQLYKKLLS